MNESIAPQQQRIDVRVRSEFAVLWRVVDSAARRMLDLVIAGLGILVLLRRCCYWPCSSSGIHPAPSSIGASASAAAGGRFAS